MMNSVRYKKRRQLNQKDTTKLDERNPKKKQVYNIPTRIPTRKESKRRTRKESKYINTNLRLYGKVC
jgi:hypothetical protein